MRDLSLSLLGAFSAVFDERPLTRFRTKAVQALLIYLVCQREQAHSREMLMALLWPELPPKSTQGNLRHALYHLRQTIPDVRGASGEAVPFLLADRQTIQVNPDGRFHLDVAEFEALTDSQAAAADWETAAARYRGDFLADFYLPDSPDFESWAQSRRADLRRRLLETLARLTSHYLDKGDFEQAEQVARRQLEIDNLHEEAHRQLMTVLAQNGRRPAALTHYQTLRQLLQDELQIEPSAETEALAAAIRSDTLSAGAREQKATEDTSVPPHNLPPQATPFIGRQAELATLDGFLADPNTRLVTITGPGGMGKTRLVMAAAERQRDRRRFHHGVFFVPLTSVDDSDLIVSAIAAAMEIRLERGEAQLLNRLRAKQLLLLLDNFERVLEGGVVVTRLLQAAPQLQILITSRERLRLQGEQLYPIQGLPEAEDAGRNDALQLFLQAAQRVRPGFQQTVENAAALRQICRLVEGMPLALELAAAWVDLLTPAEIAAEIQRNLDFLATDLHDVPARHRSVQAVFDASWQRLSPGEQHLLAQATIFEGGFTREAVTAVADASLRDLVVLVNKSLLSFAGDNGRYYMHGLLRQYAAAQLETGAALRDRHCEYYCDWVAAQIDRLRGPEQMTVVREVQADMENVRAAIIHALKQERFADLDAALPGLVEYYRVRGQIQEGIKHFQRIHGVLGSKPDLAPFTLLWTSIWLSELHGLLSQTSVSETFQQQAKALLETPFFHERDTRAERARLWHQEGYRLFQREPATAVQLFRQSQALLETLGDQAWSARNLIGLARAARNACDWNLAQETVAQSFSLAQALDNPLLQIETRLLMGNLASVAGKYAEAEGWLHEGITQLRQINHPGLLGLGLMYLFMAQRLNGRFEAALETNQELQQVGEELDSFFYQTRHFEALIRMHLGEYGHSAAIGQEALHAAQAIQENRLVYEGLRLLGLLALVKGDTAEVRAQLQASENVDRRLPVSLFSDQIFLSLVAIIEEETAVAQRFILPAIQEAVEQQIPIRLAIGIAVAACLYAIQGQPEQAIALYALAQQHPYAASSRWFADVVGKRVTAAAANLSPEAVAAAQARGQGMDMWQTAESLLRSQLS